MSSKYFVNKVKKKTYSSFIHSSLRKLINILFIIYDGSNYEQNVNNINRKMSGVLIPDTTLLNS